MEFLKFIIIYTILITSIIGYGLIFSKKFTIYNNFQYENISVGYLGLFGIFLSIIISYLTNLFSPHNNLHNLFFILIGIILFFILYKKVKKRFISKYFIFSYLISLFAIFYFKSHDDFSYYHFSLINNITENKIEFGLSHFEIAFNHVSSLFYFHSLFKTVFTGNYFYQIGQLGIVVFINTILLENIFKKNSSKFLNISFFLSLFLLILINIFFYRLAEHGTDRSAQILFFLAFILVINLIEENKIQKRIFELLIIIFSLLISIKSFYILYSVLFLIIYFRFFKITETLKIFSVFPVTYFGLLIICLMVISNIAASGCLLYPISATCFESFFWGYGKDQVVGAMQWYEIWSKAGVTPNYRVENFEEYLKNFNWISNWVDKYFFNKFFDFLLGVIFSVFILYLFFYPKNISFKNFKNYLTIYFILILLLLEWFWNHPALRYGGFVLVFLIMTFPFAVLFANQKFTFKKKFLQIKIILLIVFLVFSFRNVNRLINEHHIYDYNFLKNPNYLIDSNFYTMQNAKKNLFKDPKKCEENNSLDKIKCKKILNYNFYYNSKN